MIFDDIKVGTVLAMRASGLGSSTSAPKAVTVARVTRTQIIDTEGRRWRRKDGWQHGGDGQVEPWTERHDRRKKIARASWLAYILEKAVQDRGDSDAVLEALPHLEAAAAALEQE